MKYVRNHKKSSAEPYHVPIYPGVLPWAVAEDDSFQEELTSHCCWFPFTSPAFITNKISI